MQKTRNSVTKLSRLQLEVATSHTGSITLTGLFRAREITPLSCRLYSFQDLVALNTRWDRINTLKLDIGKNKYIKAGYRQESSVSSL